MHGCVERSIKTSEFNTRQRTPGEVLTLKKTQYLTLCLPSVARFIMITDIFQDMDIIVRQRRHHIHRETIFQLILIKYSTSSDNNVVERLVWSTALKRWCRGPRAGNKLLFWISQLNILSFLQKMITKSQ